MGVASACVASHPQEARHSVAGHHPPAPPPRPPGLDPFPLHPPPACARTLRRLLRGEVHGELPGAAGALLKALHTEYGAASDALAIGAAGLAGGGEGAPSPAGLAGAVLRGLPSPPLLPGSPMAAASGGSGGEDGALRAAPRGSRRRSIEVLLAEQALRAPGSPGSFSAAAAAAAMVLLPHAGAGGALEGSGTPPGGALLEAESQPSQQQTPPPEHQQAHQLQARLEPLAIDSGTSSPRYSSAQSSPWGARAAPDTRQQAASQQLLGLSPLNTGGAQPPCDPEQGRQPQQHQPPPPQQQQQHQPPPPPQQQQPPPPPPQQPSCELWRTSSPFASAASTPVGAAAAAAAAAGGGVWGDSSGDEQGPGLGLGGPGGRRSSEGGHSEGELFLQVGEGCAGLGWRCGPWAGRLGG